MEARRAVSEWREVLEREEKALRDVEHELLTGEPTLPMMAAAAKAKAAMKPEPDRDAWKTADPGPMDEHQCLRRR